MTRTLEAIEHDISSYRIYLAHLEGAKVTPDVTGAPYPYLFNEAERAKEKLDELEEEKKNAGD